MWSSNCTQQSLDQAEHAAAHHQQKTHKNRNLDNFVCCSWDRFFVVVDVCEIAPYQFRVNRACNNGDECKRTEANVTSMAQIIGAIPKRKTRKQVKIQNQIKCNGQNWWAIQILCASEWDSIDWLHYWMKWQNVRANESVVSFISFNSSTSRELNETNPLVLNNVVSLQRMLSRPSGVFGFPSAISSAH